MNSWDNFINTPIDYNHLPEDCYAWAAERIRRALAKGERPRGKDLLQVFGDITKGVSVPVSREELGEYFLGNRETA